MAIVPSSSSQIRPMQTIISYCLSPSSPTSSSCLSDLSLLAHDSPLPYQTCISISLPSCPQHNAKGARSSSVHHSGRPLLPHTGIGLVLSSTQICKSLPLCQKAEAALRHHVKVIPVAAPNWNQSELIFLPLQLSTICFF